MPNEYAFEMSASSVRFGWGATREVGMDLAEGKARRVLVVTDAILRELAPVATVLESLEQNGIAYDVYDRVHVEPTEESCQDAARYARDGEFDAFVVGPPGAPGKEGPGPPPRAAGGGVSAPFAPGGGAPPTPRTKGEPLSPPPPPAVSLYYVTPPIGRGLPPPGLLKPLYALPT